LENYDIKSLLIKKMILEYLQVQRLYSIGSGKEAYLSWKIFCIELLP